MDHKSDRNNPLSTRTVCASHGSAGDRTLYVGRAKVQHIAVQLTQGHHNLRSHSRSHIRRTRTWLALLHLPIPKTEVLFAVQGARDSVPAGGAARPTALLWHIHTAGTAAPTEMP